MRRRESRPDSSNDPAPSLDLGLIDSPTFFATDYKQEWLIRNIAVAKAPLVLGGPKKVLKTSFAADLAISLASGTPFLSCEQFAIPVRNFKGEGLTFSFETTRRVVIISGESGERTLQDTARRICKARDIKDPGTLPIAWGFNLPQLANPDHLNILTDALAAFKAEVVIIDPLYLALLSGMAAAGKQAGNIFDMGPLLLSVAQACLAADCTPILLHHTPKRSENARNFEPLDLAFAGCAEFARQWILLSRREIYDHAKAPGVHKLWMVTGGSAGHSGLWGVDIDEGVMGDNFEGRRWAVTTTVAGVAVQEHRTVREQEKATKKERDQKADEATFLIKLDEIANGDPEKWVKREEVKTACGFNADRTKGVVYRLCRAEIVEEQEMKVPIGSGAKRAASVVRRRSKSNQAGFA